VTAAGRLGAGRPGGTLPDRLRPMMASPGPLPDDEDGWAYEMKWDGVRAIAYIDDGGLRLQSRTGRDVTHTYPELGGLAAAVALPPAVLDGEIVAFGGAQWPSFEALQPRMNISSPAQAQQLAAQIPVSYLVFDLLCLDGQLLLELPYARRRALLEDLNLNGPRWQTPPSFTDVTGADLLAMSQQQGLEGLLAKRLESRYEPGRRAASWRKIKNVRRQEAVVGGWKPGQGGRAGQIGSLLIGVYGPEGLAYAGHVGTGLTGQTLRMLGEKLAPLRRDTPPFQTQIPPEHARGAIWVQPRLVVEVAFTEWTNAGRMRAPAYKGLRTDKDPAEVIREPDPRSELRP
jgi:bifunctional non-homologous end joining protein LigD